MPENISEKVIQKKIKKVDNLKKIVDLKSLEKLISKNKTYIDFKSKIQNNLKNNKTSIIAEIKKASPSAGVIIENYNPVEIAKIYNDNKVTCLSVLTEEDYFLGNLEHISKIKDKIKLPILCKDFFIDKFQVPLAKSNGADAILIILAGVSDDLANEWYNEALKFKMSVIVEVHTVEEAKKALNFKKALIGINNRNLKTLKTDVNTTYDIHNVLLNHQGPLISESGIKKQKNLLLFINKKLRSSGVSPSYEEMKQSLNLKSKSGIHRLISALEERGFIKRLAHKARALEVIKLPETASANDIYNSFSPSVIKGGLDNEQTTSDEMEVPVLGKIAAGTPVEAIQNEVSRIPLPSNLEKNGEYFGLKVQGDSMIEAGIFEGDTVIIRRTDTADNGKIVVALIDEHEAMLKRIRKKGKVIALESANRNYETKIFGPDRVKVQGVLVSLYRNF